jgi:hypothetical protein
MDAPFCRLRILPGTKPAALPPRHKPLLLAVYRNGSRPTQYGKVRSRLRWRASYSVLVIQRAKRLNSPNDLVAKSDGSLYFTDPPYAFVRFGLASWLGVLLVSLLPGRRLPRRFREAKARVANPLQTALLEENSLNQWRAYSRGEGGFSLAPKNM